MAEAPDGPTDKGMAPLFDLIVRHVPEGVTLAEASDASEALRGVLQAVYWVRQGGDFMHGRVLLTPLFCLLIPVVLPLPQMQWRRT